MTTERKVHPALVPLGCFALAIIFLFARKSEAFLSAELWAEDAAIFYKQAREQGLAAFFQSYAGYFHLVPRTVAAPSPYLPAAWVPLYFVWAAALITGAAVVKITRARIAFTLLPLMGLALVAVPHFGEVFVTPTNLQWVIAPVLVMLAVQEDPRSRGQFAGDIVWLVAAGLSGPFALFFWPLFAWRLRSRARNSYNVTVFTIATLCAVVQAAAILQAGQPAVPYSMKILPLWGKIVADRIVMAMLGMDCVGAKLHFVVLPLLAAPLLFLVCSTIWKHKAEWSSEQRRALTIFGVAAAVILLTTAVKFGNSATMLLFDENGDRYFYIPRIMVAWVLIAMWDIPGTPRAISRFGIAGVLVGAVVTSVYRCPSFASLWREAAPALDRGEYVKVFVNPSITTEFEPLQRGEGK